MEYRLSAVVFVFMLFTPHAFAQAGTDPRGQERTYASFPEWYIVYSAQEYATLVSEGGRPSQFPYFAATGQYWDSVRYAKEALGDIELDSNTKTVLRFIGASFTFENAVIGVYEKTIGRLSELLNFNYKTIEDTYTDSVAQEYGEFLNHTPWYAFPYFEKLGGLWQTWGWSSATPRGIERRTVFTVGYALKGIYGKVMGTLSRSSLGTAELTTSFSVSAMERASLERTEGVEISDANGASISAHGPRYRAFLPIAEAIAASGGSFTEIQGHDEIMATLLVEPSATCPTIDTYRIFSQPILTHAALERVALRIPVSDLGEVIRKLGHCDIRLEHLYDY